jgi:mediator of RNA polymerase II transcription subunit 13
MISIGKGEAVIQILPTALRFWEKLGLGPRGGKKDVTAFVLFEDDGEERQQQVETWLADVSATYSVSIFILFFIKHTLIRYVQGKHLGVLVPGSCSSCPKDGIVPLRFDSSFRKSLGKNIFI